MDEETWIAFGNGARIRDYLRGLVTRLVRENLRNMRKEAH
ncbi:MAG: DUF3562 domain-containing protein [Paraburkholderia sp.]|jgi:hypothetical protein|nr:DUF3562 domain-containing protein [Paraburkholderia sp.]